MYLYLISKLEAVWKTLVNTF